MDASGMSEWVKHNYIFYSSAEEIYKKQNVLMCPYI